MTTKISEQKPRRSGDRGGCAICNPKPERISESDLWEAARRNPAPYDPWAVTDVPVPANPMVDGRG